MNKTSDKPNPGSNEAIELGCKCPVIDNRRGKGAYFDAFGMPVFWYSDACTVHNNYNKEVAARKDVQDGCVVRALKNGGHNRGIVVTHEDY